MSTSPDSGAAVLLAFAPILLLAIYLRRRNRAHGTPGRKLAIAAACSAAMIAIGVLVMAPNALPLP